MTKTASACRRTGGFLCGALCVLGTAVLGLLGVLNVVFTSDLDLHEKSTTQAISPFDILSAVLLCAVLFLLLRFGDRIDEGRLFCVLAGITLIGGLFLLFSADGSLRADAYYVHEATQQILRGDLSSFSPGGYLFRYPHQLGLVLYELPLTLIAPDAHILFFANLSCVIATDLFVLRITQRLWENDRAVARTAVFLSFAFLPQLFFILFAYGLIPGFTAMCAGLYLLLCFDQGGRWPYLIGGALLLAAAVLIKKNFAIGAAAAVIFLLLRLLRQPDKRRAAACLLVPAVCLLLRPAAYAVFTAATGTETGDGMPSILWVAMGTDPDNRYFGPGWYDGYTEQVYADSGYDTPRAAETGREKLRESLARFRTDPALAADFFGQKLISTWCEPTFQSIWSGPLSWCGQSTHNALARSIYDQGTAYRVLSHGMKGMLLVLLLSALGGVIAERRRPERFAVPCLYLIGGVLFHLAWETKSQYVYPYIFLLIPPAASAQVRLYRRIMRGKADQA